MELSHATMHMCAAWEGAGLALGLAKPKVDEWGSDLTPGGGGTCVHHGGKNRPTPGRAGDMPSPT